MKDIALKKEFDYYVSHQDELVKKFNGKYVVINNEKITGVFNDENQAILESSKKYKPGTFLVHLVGPGKENYTQVFHSRVRI